MSATDWTSDTPVAGQEGDPDFGACRVCQYHDSGTGALMYRIEKESTTPPDEAELICIHVSAAYCRRLLAAMKADMGGELGAKGAMLLIRGAAQASDGEHTVAQSKDRPAGHPAPLRPTRHNPEGSPDWSGQSRPEDAITVPKGAITPPEDGSDSTGELPF
jgi:hypothetical protein|nr:MAG TPA: hypothetical protein [Caudoviricetes sp.]